MMLNILTLLLVYIYIYIITRLYNLVDRSKVGSLDLTDVMYASRKADSLYQTSLVVR